LIKRCIGLPGDTVVIREGIVYINGKIFTFPPSVKMSYVICAMNFPHPDLRWTLNNYGPVIVPSKGSKISLDSTNIELYRNIIQSEGYEIFRKDPVIYINGKAVSTYIFETDAYFVLGDNRGNSIDSRYWGFVAKDLMVGKAVLVYFSKDTELKRIRWNRFFKEIR
jgi:signal peptidase I